MTSLQTIGVIGAGTMGTGIAQVCALAGRLENLVTGQQREFTSGHELLESIASDLEASTSARSVDAPRSDDQERKSL